MHLHLVLALTCREVDARALKDQRQASARQKPRLNAPRPVDNTQRHAGSDVRHEPETILGRDAKKLAVQERVRVETDISVPADLDPLAGHDSHPLPLILDGKAMVGIHLEELARGVVEQFVVNEVARR